MSVRRYDNHVVTSRRLGQTRGFNVPLADRHIVNTRTRHELINLAYLRERAELPDQSSWVVRKKILPLDDAVAPETVKLRVPSFPPGSSFWPVIWIGFPHGGNRGAI